MNPHVSNFKKTTVFLFIGVLIQGPLATQTSHSREVSSEAGSILTPNQQKIQKVKNLIDAGKTAAHSFSETQSTEKIETVLASMKEFSLDPENAKILASTVEGKQLLRTRNKFSNYLAIHKKLKACRDEQNIAGTIISGAWGARYVQDPCISLPQTESDQYFGLGSHIRNTEGILDAVLEKYGFPSDRKRKVAQTSRDRSIFVNEFYAEALRTAAENYYYIARRFKPDNETEEEQQSRYKSLFSDLSTDLCTSRGQKQWGVIAVCKGVASKILKPHFAANKYNRPADPDERQTYSDAAVELGKRSRKANEILATIAHRAKPTDLVFKTPMHSKALKKRHDKYVLELLKQASNGAGLLFFSDQIQSQGMRVRQYAPKKAGLTGIGDSDVYRWETSPGGTEVAKYVPHSTTFTKHNVRAAVQDVKSDIVHSMKDVLMLMYENYRNPGDKTNWEHVVELTELSPVALGRLLVQYPLLAEFVCSAIDEIRKRRVRGEAKKKVAVIGGMVVGGVLLLSGVGSGVGAAILTKAGLTGAAATAAAVGEVTLVVGAIAGALDAAYQGTTAYQEFQKYDKLRRSFIAGLGGTSRAKEAIKKYIEFEESLFNAELGAAFMFFDAASLRQLVYGGELFSEVADASVKAERLGRLSGLIQKFSNTRLGQRLQGAQAVVRDVRVNLYAKFLTAMAKVGPRGEKVAFHLMKALETNGDLARAMEGFYNVCQKNCK